MVSDQCPSYNWIAADRHQLCWAHVKRNLQQWRIIVVVGILLI
ncbi:hypothetical protein NM452_13275 [Vibrio metschnikovii]